MAPCTGRAFGRHHVSSLSFGATRIDGASLDESTPRPCARPVPDCTAAWALALRDRGNGEAGTTGEALVTETLSGDMKPARHNAGNRGLSENALTLMVEEIEELYRSERIRGHR